MSSSHDVVAYTVAELRQPLPQLGRRARYQLARLIGRRIAGRLLVGRLAIEKWLTEGGNLPVPPRKNRKRSRSKPAAPVAETARVRG